jgi:hypothetical protein
MVGNGTFRLVLEHYINFPSLLESQKINRLLLYMAVLMGIGQFSGPKVLPRTPSFISKSPPGIQDDHIDRARIIMIAPSIG